MRNVAVPASCFFGKSTVRSSVACSTRASSGREYEWGSRPEAAAAAGLVEAAVSVTGFSFLSQARIVVRAARKIRRFIDAREYRNLLLATGPVQRSSSTSWNNGRDEGARRRPLSPQRRGEGQGEGRLSP